MSKRIYNNQTMTRYLLGSLPEAETEALDELSVADDEVAYALKVAETDLVDAYVRGELTGAALEQFNSYYLASPLRREKVRFAQAFQVFAEKETGAPATEALAEAPAASATQRKVSSWFGALNIFQTPRPALQWGAAFAALALLVAGGWLILENKRLRQQVSQTQERRDALVEREKELQRELEEQRTAKATTEQDLARVREERARLEQELKQEQQRALEPQRTARQQPPSGTGGGGSLASFILTPQMRGAGQIQTISLPAQTDDVAMQLQLEPNDYSAYRVALLDQSGGQILWRSGTLRARAAAGDSQSLTVRFRASLLKPQAYMLRVYGSKTNGESEILGDYPFKVVE
jgi:hypothetical protein